jgi:hypothetical protein
MKHSLLHSHRLFFNNKIYQCVQSYTQSFSDTSTSYITPTNTDYWNIPTIIRVEQPTNNESILEGQIYLTTDKYYFEFGWTGSNSITLASAAEKYKEDLKLFNIDIFYKNDKLQSDLIYPSEYAIVNYYKNDITTPNKIGQTNKTVERLVGIKEELNYELNYDISENFRFNIVITDIDEFGLKIIINKMVYEEEISWVFSGGLIDMERTIDRTLRNWLTRNYINLYTLGIIAELKYTGNFTSVYNNSIVFNTQYPNVPMILNDVLVGTTANYYIEHSKILFNDLGPYLNININDVDYGIESIYQSTTQSSNVNISQTITNWYNEYHEELSRFGIIVTNINSLLMFNLKRLDRRFDFKISTGKLKTPGINDYTIIRSLVGNLGMLVASNEVLLPKSSTASFIDEGFATGMITSINNTFWTWNNQEYNITFLDDDILNLSYQGPFWGLTDSICNSSAYTTIAFNLGFGQTGCPAPFLPTAGGPYNPNSFDQLAFALSYNPNVYTVNDYNLNLIDGVSNLVDIIYIQLSSSIYALGDGLLVIDALHGNYITTIELTGNTQSIEIEFNTVNNYIYCLSQTSVYVIDPLNNTLINTIYLSPLDNPFDMQINPINGDVYISYSNQPKVDIWSANNFNTPTYTISISDPLFPMSATRTGKMVFNDFQQDMYITTDSDELLRVNTTRDIQMSYTIGGLVQDFAFYEPVNENVYVYGTSGLHKIDGLSVTQINSMTNEPFIDMIFNNITGEMNISDSSTNFTRLDISSDSINQSLPGSFGYLALNQFDGAVYISSQSTNSIVVMNPENGISLYSSAMSSPTGKLVYNPERKSIWSIKPQEDSLVEIKVDIMSTIDLVTSTFSSVDENSFGTLDPNYVVRPSIWLKTRDYIRRPRENFEGDVRVEYYWKWQTDEFPEIFMYDFSGDQLLDNGVYTYIGEKPLKQVILNKNPNRNIDNIKKPEYQQTIFDRIKYDLSYINDSEDFSTEVEPLQLFLGFKKEEECASESKLQLFKRENITISIESNQLTNISLSMDDNGSGFIKINDMSSEFFINKGLKTGQIIAIYLKDVTNNKNQYISDNNASIFKIRSVFNKELILDLISENDQLFSENTVVENYPNFGDITYLRLTIEVQDKEVCRFNVLGQTEEEDERFKIELGNIGKLIDPDDVFIFKSYDILEGGIDWIYLNKKRKEMLMMKHLIYPYIGAYKSIINAINYFGYNDLQLNEYYRNVNTESENFSKLFKVEIPTIFDNSIPGWEENDFILNTFPNDNYEETKMFNLTYLITNKGGDNILNYTLDEVVIKLQGLKYWLKRNIIPLTHKIMDITGQFYINSGNYIKHKTFDVRTYNIKEEMTPITFKLNEAYLMPVNTGSSVYNCVLDFYSIIPSVGTEHEFLEKTKAFNGSKLVLPDHYYLKVKTYKTYKEWAPFSNYNKMDRIIYFGKLYESFIDNNKTKNPRKYESAQKWSANIAYSTTTIVEHKREYYVFSGLGSTQSTLSPNLDSGPNNNWRNITEWKLIDYDPVQTITEWRKGDNLLPFNFTIDSNLDPFIKIEVISDNGYGSTWGDRRNYEIRGTRDLQDTSGVGESIGPFQPIEPII